MPLDIAFFFLLKQYLNTSQGLHGQSITSHTTEKVH